MDVILIYNFLSTIKILNQYEIIDFRKFLTTNISQSFIDKIGFNKVKRMKYVD